jgi:surface antigen
MATQNKQIKVSKDTVIKSFTNEIQVDYAPSAQRQKDQIYAEANQYRCAYPPVFADDSWYLPTASNTAQVQVQVTTKSSSIPDFADSITNATNSVTNAINNAPIGQSIAQSITNVTNGQPITAQQKDDLGKALLIALGIFVVIKIVS